MVYDIINDERIKGRGSIGQRQCIHYLIYPRMRFYIRPDNANEVLW